MTDSKIFESALSNALERISDLEKRIGEIPPGPPGQAGYDAIDDSDFQNFKKKTESQHENLWRAIRSVNHLIFGDPAKYPDMDALVRRVRYKKGMEEMK